MAACGSKSGGVTSGSRNNRSCDQSCEVKVQEWTSCDVPWCSVLQKEQNGVSVNLNL